MRTKKTPHGHGSKRRIGSNGLVTLALSLSLALMMVPSAAGQGAQGAIPPSYDISQLRSWRDGMLPTIERIMGRSFTAAPAVEAVTQAELARALAGAAGEPNDDTLAAGLLGWYDARSGRVLLRSDVGPMFIAAKVDAAAIPRVMQLVLARQLSRALSNQAASASPPGGERDRLGIEEGVATVVQERMAVMHEWTNEDRALRRLLSLTGVTDTTYAAARDRYAAVVAPAQKRVRDRIGGGRLEPIWSMLATPPRVAVDVVQPAPRAPGAIDPDVLFDGYAETLGANFTNNQVIVSEGSKLERTHAVLSALSDGRFVENVRGSYMLILSDRTARPPVIRAATIYDLSTPGFGANIVSYSSAARTVEFKEVIEIATERGGEIREQTIRSLPGLRCERVRAFRLQIWEPGATTDQTPVISMAMGTAWRGGRYVAQLNGMGGFLDDEAFGLALNALLDRAEGLATPIVTDPVTSAFNRLGSTLAGGSWSGPVADVDPATAGTLVGEAGQFAVTAGFVRGWRSVRRADASDGFVAVTVLELLQPDFAAALADPLADAAANQIGAVLSAERPVQFGAAVRRTVASDAPVVVRPFSITRQGQDPLKGSLYIAHRDRYAIRVIDVGDALGSAGVDEFLTDVLGRQ